MKLNSCGVEHHKFVMGHTYHPVTRHTSTGRCSLVIFLHSACQAEISEPRRETNISLKGSHDWVRRRRAEESERESTSHRRRSSELFSLYALLLLSLRLQKSAGARVQAKNWFVAGTRPALRASIPFHCVACVLLFLRAAGLTSRPMETHWLTGLPVRWSERPAAWWSCSHGLTLPWPSDVHCGSAD